MQWFQSFNILLIIILYLFLVYTVKWYIFVIQTKQNTMKSRISLTQWIKANRMEIDEYIKRVSPNARLNNARLNDAERRLWIINVEGLYNWAKSEKVNI